MHVANERELIARIRKLVRRSTPPPFIKVGIGDDCAVLAVKQGHQLLVTTDLSIEGVHFRRDWHPPEVVGYRCLLRGLSDIAAMGGEPGAGFLSLALPRNFDQNWVDEFFSGLLSLARKYRVVLAGGDVSQSPGGVLADIAVVGQVPKSTALMRSGARAGDGVYVTGTLGGGAKLVSQLRHLNSPTGRKAATAFVAKIASQHRMTVRDIGSVQGHPASVKMEQEGVQAFWPEPRIAVGQALRGMASACIDLSDGLSTDLSHVCEESGVGAIVQAEAVPVAHGASLQMALHGGEDYELLFTSSKAVPAKIAGVKVTLIGEIVRGKDMQLVYAGGNKRTLVAGGWEHFREPRQRGAKRGGRAHDDH